MDNHKNHKLNFKINQIYVNLLLMKTHYISRIYHKSKLPQKVLRGFIASVHNSDSPVSHNAIVLRVVSAYGGWLSQTSDSPSTSTEAPRILKLLTLMSLFAKCWDYRHEPPHLVFNIF